MSAARKTGFAACLLLMSLLAVSCGKTEFMHPVLLQGEGGAVISGKADLEATRLIRALKSYRQQ